MASADVRLKLAYSWRTRRQSAWPSSAARCAGVRAYSSVADRLAAAPSSWSARRQLACPSNAAIWAGVKPAGPAADREWWSRHTARRLSTSPTRHASCAGLKPRIPASRAAAEEAEGRGGVAGGSGARRGGGGKLRESKRDCERVCGVVGGQGGRWSIGGGGVRREGGLWHGMWMEHRAAFALLPDRARACLHPCSCNLFLCECPALTSDCRCCLSLSRLSELVRLPGLCLCVNEQRLNAQPRSHTHGTKSSQA